MNSPAELDIGPLSWVKDEIELALGRVAEQLQKYDGALDEALLADARMHLHQAHGALSIVGLDGITEFSLAIERLLDALVDKSVPWSSARGGAAREGATALIQYLDELVGGRPNQPLRLLPAYRRLCEARGDHEAVAADLFFPDLTQRPPRRDVDPAPLDEAARQMRLKAARLGFGRGLGKWTKQDSSGVRDMRNSIVMIEALHDQPAARAFWWVTLAFFDAMAAGGIANDEGSQRLCGRIDAQLKKLIEGTHAVAERLIRDVLYEVATTEVSDDHIDSVRAAYRLRDLLPNATVDDPNEAVLRKMRDRLGHTVDSWDHFCAGAAIALPEFHQHSSELLALTQQLQHVDLARLVAGLSNTANLLRKNPLLHSDALATEIATVLLLAEEAINHFDALDVEFAEQIDVVTVRLNALQRGEQAGALKHLALQQLAQRAASRIAVHQLARTLRAQLLLVEQGLDAFFRDERNTKALAGVADPLLKTIDMFEQLDQHRAVVVVRDCARQIQAFATPGYLRQPGEFEEVARKISALGFFVERLQLGQADLELLLAPPGPAAAPELVSSSVEVEISQMARMARTIVGVMRGKLGDAPMDDDRRDALRTELKQNLEGVRENARLVADEAVERQADAALKALVSEASPDRIEEIVAPLAVESRLAGEAEATLTTAEAARLAEASTTEVDAELLAIFIEEVLQALDTAGVQLYRSIANPEKSEHLAILRRSFHMLKGSARLIGLLDFSDAARAVESTIGLHLKGGKPASKELHAMLDTAQRMVSEWVERLQRRANAPDTTPLLRQCQALQLGIERDVDKDSEGAIPVASRIVKIGELEVDRALYEIYLEEARANLAVLEKEWQRTPSRATIRAAHTLAGTSATLGVAEVQVLAKALEMALERFSAAALATDATQDATLQLALRRLTAMVTSIADQRQPEIDDQLVSRLNAMTATPTLISATDTFGADPVARAQPVVRKPDNEFLPLFLEECQDLMPSIAAAFKDWRNSGDVFDKRGAGAVQRLLHTLKGSARMAGLADIGEAVHGVETRVADAQARASASGATSTLIDELEAEFDKAAAMIDALSAVPEVAESETQTQTLAPTQTQHPMLRLRADVVDLMVNASGEISIARARIEGGAKTLRASLADLTENVARFRTHLRELEIQAESSIQSQIGARVGKVQNRNFDPLEMDRFTRLQELTRILAESVNDVATVEYSLMRDLDQVDTALIQQARLSRELTQRLMSVRMVPFASVSERLQRVVRLSADELGKRVNFVLDGGDTELDRSVLERMTGPIEHLLRNAVVHGIETSEQRAASGKSAAGEVRLSLLQTGSEVEISVNDDGGGLDYARIRNEAVKRGLMTAEQRADESQLAQLIYQPGFTTAATLSAIAGRGVGMDVVRSETTALGGRIDVRAESKRGTSFSLHLPLTLAVVPALLVKSAARTYAIPSAMVVQANEMKPEAMDALRATGQVDWQGQQYALHYLPRLLGNPAAQPGQRLRHWVILLRAGVQRVALEIDSLIGNEEVVIKNIGPQMARLKGFSGATVLGDGEVVLILNPVALVGRPVIAPSAAMPVAEVVGTPPVMVVDDSLTVRKITGRLLERAGYRVMTAKDGVDALEQLTGVLPLIVLADIEMPRMDGFELLRNMRADERLKKLPVVMITSRIADKHRNYAMELGANHYLGKPYDEEALLAIIAGYARG